MEAKRKRVRKDEAKAEPDVKRQRQEKVKSMPDLHKKLTNLLPLLEGPKVTLIVGEARHKLPKLLVCYCSPYFDAAFNGNFQEGMTLEMKLDTTAEAFDLFLRWMYNGQLVKCGDWALSADHTKETLTQYLRFLQLADYIDLLGPFDTLLNDIGQLLYLSTWVLTAEHLEVASRVPSGRPTRALIVKACTALYLQSIETPTKKTFSLMEEMIKLPGLATDVFGLVDEAMRKRKAVSYYGDKSYYKTTITLPTTWAPGNRTIDFR